MAHPTIDSHLGSFLLGSTSPDIRILTKGKRDDTHFATLQVQSIGMGVAGLFHSYPAIADSSKVSGPTRAFLSGYLVHLLADEAWILDIYRPYFDDPLLFPDRVHANISDRALQLDMDRAAREEMGDMDQVRSSLDGLLPGISCQSAWTHFLGKLVISHCTRDNRWSEATSSTGLSLKLSTGTRSNVSNSSTMAARPRQLGLRLAS